MYTTSCDLTTLPALAKEIRQQMPKGGILLLRGNLASGKTSFVKAFANVLGIKKDIASPTFAILHEYDQKLFHYDIYQCGSEGFLSSGLLEKLDEEGYHLIEWGDIFFEKILQSFALPYATLDIETDDLKRTYKVDMNAYA
ncbi:MAG: tRNA (adenosine(37)-N6)-threonylcarbamoyltransferase complex ATPase subunit type 1 TsaE [Sulfurospirillaceae bacterium]|nr:tRNA (adenosine(37)-N6)-threonylcarbamoyltransferase complex ATPase subunit type 1 TsaE [Sulfurospirillaceae bacterium]MDD2827391.1 tRNA (adenosine(37)-N6)-threonylcarbamoyltransferase complex ATPase subunit type 1 TsaE [Sulfurospirillaceae bacterium]